MNKKALITTRPLMADDYNFIMATWLRGLYYGNEWFNKIPKDTFMSSYHRIINSILVRPDINIVVSCLIEDPSVILGYAVLEKQTLHWVFVKQAWRGIGLSSDMIPKDITTVTHLTRVGELIRPPTVEFNPFFS